MSVVLLIAYRNGRGTITPATMGMEAIMRYGVLLIAALSVSACATNQTWTRIDHGATNANAVAQAKTVCELRADAEASAAMAGPGRRYVNTGDAIGSGIADGIKQAGIANQLLRACMAERGYVLASN